MSYRAVLFDLDETLFNRTASLRLFLSDQISRHEELRFVSSEHLISSFLALDKRGRVPKDQVYKMLLKDSGPVDEKFPTVLFHEYETTFWRFAQPFHGMERMFAAIKQLGIKTSIVTNGQTHIQLRTLLALNLDRMVDDYLISEAVGFRKPDGEIFELAADRLTVKPHECIFVGDTAATDIVGAQRSGMKGVWFPNGAEWDVDGSETPDASISSLSEVTELIQRSI